MNDWSPLGITATRRRRKAAVRWRVVLPFLLLPVLPVMMGAYEPSAMLGVNNLSELTSQSTARTNLGLGSIATQAANNVALTGGSIDGTPVGGTTRAAVSGTTGNFNGILTTGSGMVRNLRVVIASGAVTMATTDDIVEVNKTSGAATVVNFISSPVTGTHQCVKDGKGDAATNNITLTPAAGNIDSAATFVMNQNWEMICVAYDGSKWIIE